MTLVYTPLMLRTYKERYLLFKWKLEMVTEQRWHATVSGSCGLWPADWTDWRDRRLECACVMIHRAVMQDVRAWPGDSPGLSLPLFTSVQQGFKIRHSAQNVIRLLTENGVLKSTLFLFLKHYNTCFMLSKTVL